MPSCPRAPPFAGSGHWDVALSGMVNGRSVMLAAIPLDEWISLSATQYVLELEAEGAGLLKPMAPMSER